MMMMMRHYISRYLLCIFFRSKIQTYRKVLFIHSFFRDSDELRIEQVHKLFAGSL